MLTSSGCRFMAGGDLWSALAQEDTEYQWHRRCASGLHCILPQHWTDPCAACRGKTVAYQIAQALAYLHTREQVVRPC